MKPPYAIGSVPILSGRAIAYRWRSLPRVRRHRASKPQGSSERGLPWQVTMDQLIFASMKKCKKNILRRYNIIVCMCPCLCLCVFVFMCVCVCSELRMAAESGPLLPVGNQGLCVCVVCVCYVVSHFLL